MKNPILILLALCCQVLRPNCQNAEENGFPTGTWLGIVSFGQSQPDMDVPFNFRHYFSPEGKEIVEILNAEDRIITSEIYYSGDLVIIKLPVHQAEINATCKNDTLTGTFYPRGKNEKKEYCFHAIYNVTDRYPGYSEPPSDNLSGRWKITENPGTPEESVMIGVFRQQGSRVTGTVLTTTGDYRYLEGKLSGKNFMLSCFDGGFCMSFRAELSASGTLENGKFAGSPAWKSNWRAERDEKVKLPDAYSLVTEKAGAPPFGFSFPDLNGNIISLSDEQFRNKVVIIQVMGTWCANCKDETFLFEEFYKKYHSGGLEIVALCFESNDRDISEKRIKRFIDHTGAGYIFLYAGEASRENRNKILSHLEGSVAYPTSVFIDRNGKIRKVHTGFSGPATGEEYSRYVKETSLLIEQLLNETQ
jgi:thiol-disulfide isomerase/thioredoxin